jgi:hypothetical protein
MGAIHGLVRRLEDTGANADELPPAVDDVVAQYGHAARRLAIPDGRSDIRPASSAPATPA